jgi:hypothetical protein
MAAWDTVVQGYTLPDGLDDIGQTLSGTATGLNALGFGTEILDGAPALQAAKDNGATVVSLSFWFLGPRSFGKSLFCYSSLLNTDEEIEDLVNTVQNAINFFVP